MSTYLYLVCPLHEPPLRSADEVGQHLSDLPTIRDYIADRQALAAAMENWKIPSSEYFRRAAATFLQAHPNCPVTIADEYGTTHPVDPDVPAARHLVLDVPRICGSRQRLRETSPTTELVSGEILIVNFADCLDITVSAIDELITLALGDHTDTFLELQDASTDIINRIDTRAANRGIPLLRIKRPPTP